FFIANGPEKRDSDFSKREFINNCNGELVGAYGNFVNRNLAFITRYFDGVVPEGRLEVDIASKIEELFVSAGARIEQGRFKEALEEIFGFVRFSNKYFDSEKPWETRKSDISACGSTLFNCVQIIANTAVLLSPFLPFSSDRIFGWLGLKSEWRCQFVESGFVLPETGILFERIGKDGDSGFDKI
ncbi:MAG: class I tRNA ligase family protein, partial [Clostridiales bacterium]|nr:class I tRNA ligase family protein [Clostridiales bacterium]